MVKDLHQTDKYLFVLLRNNMGHVIPRWAFDSAADAEAFYQEAVSYYRGAR
jgi:hypothetical protein